MILTQVEYATQGSNSEGRLVGLEARGLGQSLNGVVLVVPPS